MTEQDEGEASAMANQTDLSQVASILSLQTSLRAATRALHTQLNVGVTGRLPQCLPPHASDPTAYYLGMLTFGQIFVAVERGMERILSENSQDHNPTVETKRQKRILETQYTSGLARTVSLKHDTAILSKRLLSLKYPSGADALSAMEEKVWCVANERTRYITEHIRDRPYLAMAYTWTMYLALFNGGRHIHRGLARAGPEFWLEDSPSPSARIGSLSFWHFNEATEEDPDADQLKSKFKRGFDEASQLLTDSEREEVVQEAKSIFELCMELVEFLDGVMEEYAQQTARVATLPDLGRPSTGSKTWSEVVSGLVAPLGRILSLGWTRPLVQEGKE